MKGLIIKKEWLDKIFDEGKVWEMRSTRTNVKGKIGLIESGSGMIVGEAELLMCVEVTKQNQSSTFDLHKVTDLRLLDKWKYAWVLSRAKRYETRIPYKHPQGAVIWVNL